MSIETAKINRAEHKIVMLGRENAEVRGVTDVISFDEQSVVLDTVCGSLAVEGASLHIHVLNIEQGIVAMDGRIDSVSYFETDKSEKSTKSGILSKIFR